MTGPTETAATHVLPLQYSSARQWGELRAFVHDALADAMHHEAVLQGARPRSLSLLVSGRRLGGVHPREEQRQLEILSGELRLAGVPHAIHRVLPGDVEPDRHQLRITLRRP
jgi:hypothetical protein